MVKGTIAVLALTALLAPALPAGASDAGYIYGSVVTEDGETYRGQIRWGDEEAFWHDTFNATKRENEWVQYVDDDVLDRLRDRQNFWERLFEDRDEEFGHIFAIRFGDLKRIDVGSGDRLTVTFRNGEELELEGGSNDVGARLTVATPESGERMVRWNRIRSIEFADAPQRIVNRIGEPLYGTAKTRRYDFTGYIQWDHDECLSIDELDGDTSDGDVSIEFGDIAAIRKHRRGAMVTLRNGSEEYLTGSNDVNDGNRGVLVKTPEIGTIRIGWDDFEEVRFQHPAPGSGPGYDAYAGGVPLAGVVETRRGRFEGRIVFDLDESWDFELLHGRNNDTEYLIPFREIVRITPKGRYRASVHLRNGLEIELEEAQDVTRDNHGLLVFTNDRRPAYVDWRDVVEIRFAGR